MPRPFCLSLLLLAFRIPTMTTKTEIKKNSLVRLDIEDLAYGGMGVGRVSGGFVVFVDEAVPGDCVDVRIVKKKSILVLI